MACDNLRPLFVKTISDRPDAFRRQFFPRVRVSEWNDWRWQLRNSFKDLNQLERILVLSDSERAGLQAGRQLPSQITPYYASLFDPKRQDDPLRRTVVMTSDEFLKGPGEADDPLDEDGDLKAPGLVHRYPDRVLFLVTPLCPVYCRYCTRSRMVGDTAGHPLGVEQWTGAIDYIAAHPEIRDVLLSGGDPLLLSDDKLEWLLTRLRAIKHVELLRIGTKVPAVLAAAHYAAPGAHAQAPASVLDERAFHAPERVDARGQTRVRPARRRRHSAR